MKKAHLFGNSIEPDCKYCENCVLGGSNFACKLNRTMKDGKCRKFSYNPTLRIPKKASVLPEYDENDFKL